MTREVEEFTSQRIVEATSDLALNVSRRLAVEGFRDAPRDATEGIGV
jgi:hypothetical protein